MNNIIITGPPRSGTTLTCYLLNQLDEIVALHEPMSLSDFQNKSEGLKNIDEFFIRMRTMILENGEAISKVKAGKIPDNPFGKRVLGKRKSKVKKEVIKIEKELNHKFCLAIKHNGHFSFLLKELTLKYKCYAIIRNPLACILSWNSIQAPVSKGNLTVLKNLNPFVYQQLNAIPDLLDRQVKLLELLYANYRLLDPSQIIKYEDIIKSSGRSLAQIHPKADFLNVGLENKNFNKIYDRNIIEELYNKLVRSPGLFWDHYSKNDLAKIADFY